MGASGGGSRCSFSLLIGGMDIRHQKEAHRGSRRPTAAYQHTRHKRITDDRELPTAGGPRIFVVGIFLHGKEVRD